jgi:phage terminase small subunit
LRQDITTISDWLAGYSGNSAAVAASRLFRNAKIQAHIEKRLSESFEFERVIIKKTVLDYLKALAFDSTANVSHKLRACELLMRYLGMFDKDKDPAPTEVRVVFDSYTLPDTAKEG